MSGYDNLITSFYVAQISKHRVAYLDPTAQFAHAATSTRFPVRARRVHAELPHVKRSPRADIRKGLVTRFSWLMQP
jgi:hypothetical protein